MIKIQCSTVTFELSMFIYLFYHIQTITLKTKKRKEKKYTSVQDYRQKEQKKISDFVLNNIYKVTERDEQHYSLPVVVVWT